MDHKNERMEESRNRRRIEGLPTNTGLEEFGTETGVSADSMGHFPYIRPRRLTDRRYRIDRRNSLRQHRIRRLKANKQT